MEHFLPPELWNLIFSFCDKYTFFISQTCSHWRNISNNKITSYEIIDELLKEKNPLVDTFFKFKDIMNKLPKQTYFLPLHSKRKENKIFFDKIARNGYTHILNYIHTNKFKINMRRMYCKASEKGQTNIMSWIKNKGYVLLEKDYKKIGKKGNLEAISWLLDKKMPNDVHIMVVVLSETILHKREDILKIAHDKINNHPGKKEICKEAVSTRLNITKWILHKNLISPEDSYILSSYYEKYDIAFWIRNNFTLNYSYINSELMKMKYSCDLINVNYF